MYMPRGNLDLCRSTPLLVLLRERLLKVGPDVGRNEPVRLNDSRFIDKRHDWSGYKEVKKIQIN